MVLYTFYMRIPFLFDFRDLMVVLVHRSTAILEDLMPQGYLDLSITYFRSYLGWCHKVILILIDCSYTYHPILTLYIETIPTIISPFFVLCFTVTLQLGSYLGYHSVEHIHMLLLAHLWFVLWNQYENLVLKLLRDAVSNNIYTLMSNLPDIYFAFPVVGHRSWFLTSNNGPSSLHRFANFQGTDEIVDKSLKSKDGLTTCEDFVNLAQTWLSKIKVFQL